MSEVRPDPLDRLDATADALVELREIVDAEEALDDILARVAAGAARAIPDADAVTITVLADGDRRTAAWTNPDVVEIDERQYEAGRGPCLESARSQKPVRAAVGEHGHQWPEFAEAAERHDIHAYLSVPLVVEGLDGGHLGSLNIYGRAPTAFDPFDEGLMLLFAATATDAIRNARRWRQLRELVGNLETALISRAEIDQAKGILMALHGVTADEAFAMLAERSQRRNVKVRQIAHEFVAAAREAALRRQPGTPNG